MKETEGLKIYLRGIAEDMSGEALWRRGKALLRIFGSMLSEQEYRDVWTSLRLLRREANKLHPPKTGGATPISLRDLATLWGKAQRASLPAIQREALDILVVAFATVSRGFEIASLTTEDVAKDGSWIRVRPKTFAATWKRLLKRVDNAPGLPVRDILKKYRARALKRRSPLLWSVAEEVRDVWRTDAISKALAGAASSLGFNQRVSAHSARKGAALEALFAGAPLPVIQAFGGWHCIDSLQAYLAEGVRRSSSVFQVVLGDRGREEEGKERKNKKQEGSKIY